MNTCYIVCALDSKLDFLPNETDLVIGADRGFEILSKQGIRIDLAIGDFDSCENEIAFDKIIKYPVMKDDTDSALAVKYATEKGYKRIMVYGGIGGELSHTIANLSIICDYAEKGINITFVDGENVVFAIHNASARFSNEAKGKISVFSHNDISYGVHESGLLYTLDNYDLTNKTTLGAGNQFISENSEISVKNGTLIICTSKNNFDKYLTI